MTTGFHRFTAGGLAFAFASMLGAPSQTLAQDAKSQAAAASTSAPQDRWPRKFTANGNAIDLYTPQLDSWDGRTIEWHAAVSITAPGSEGADLRSRVRHGEDRRGQDDPPGRRSRRSRSRR